MQKIGVVGGGTMGAGIAEVCAKAGSDVLVLETRDEFAKAALSRITDSLARGKARGKLAQVDVDSTLAKLTTTTDIADLADCDLVIEAAPEIEALKKDIFGKLDAVVKPSAILATNTSSIPVVKVAVATRRPERVVGVHFFNPVSAMGLVEIISTLSTSSATTSAVSDYVTNTLGKTAVHAGDQSGFIVNALLIPYLCQSIRMLESGYATAEDIDSAMTHGCGYPMGPLALLDTIGLDVALAIAESLYQEFAEPHYAPPVMLRRLVDSGRLGKKSGRGFFEYS
ncbi:3-hydroxybutyryl-CoA dehydrogenase [Rhodococcus erythropolis]|uniref:3-hydroxybutyryl-CoA dehydrogenase n=1 Tax=Rhodococcus erythropolis TaxID=1833 RepID=UPI001BE723FB|nr:3-hydroxybutyryl-CoA dehydrogenase [Rhodococcus erythropolis]MBT2266097.1 3-hydroxybutyryl-CoA dehydrogenase [Rhodococcus erythropolis]